MAKSSYEGYYQPEAASPVASPAIIKHQVMNDATLALTQTINSSHEVLATATTVFPFTLFPDTVTMDREKLTITHKEFFWTSETMSIRIEDILNVTADTGPVFGSLKISTRFFSVEKPYSIKWLSRKDAIKIKRIVQGYIIARQKNIDCTTLPSRDLAGMLEQLGR